jgi:hypothetical protein
LDKTGAGEELLGSRLELELDIVLEATLLLKELLETALAEEITLLVVPPQLANKPTDRIATHRIGCFLISLPFIKKRRTTLPFFSL